MVNTNYGNYKEFSLRLFFALTNHCNPRWWRRY